ncbi:MAG: hypothetical protein ABS949_02610 [Solibacillus sp.]
MTMYRKTIVIGLIAALAVISLLVFVPAKLADGKEQKAVLVLEAAFAETFAVTKSNALQKLFSDVFAISLQSENSSIVYDFTMRGQQFAGDYYTEQLHVEVARLVESQVDGLVLAKTDVSGLTELTALADAQVMSVQLMLLVEEPLIESEAQQVANTVKASLGDVNVQLDIIVIDDKEAFTGVTYEIEHFFQQSTITKESFDGIEFEEQQFQF